MLSEKPEGYLACKNAATVISKSLLLVTGWTRSRKWAIYKNQ